MKISANEGVFEVCCFGDLANKAKDEVLKNFPEKNISDNANIVIVDHCENVQELEYSDPLPAAFLCSSPITVQARGEMYCGNYGYPIWIGPDEEQLIRNERRRPGRKTYIGITVIALAVICFLVADNISIKKTTCIGESSKTSEFSELNEKDLEFLSVEHRSALLAVVGDDIPTNPDGSYDREFDNNVRFAIFKADRLHHHLPKYIPILYKIKNNPNFSKKTRDRAEKFMFVLERCHSIK